MKTNSKDNKKDGIAPEQTYFSNEALPARKVLKKGLLVEGNTAGAALTVCRQQQLLVVKREQTQRGQR